MKDLISWLREIELLAHSVYASASEAMMEKPELASFLKRLAADEIQHYHLISSARTFLEEHGGTITPGVSVDDDAKMRIAGPIKALEQRLEDGSATDIDVLRAIVQSETTEWNDFFLYVIDICAQASVAFQYVAATIQAHERRIEGFLKSLEGDNCFSELMELLPKIWSHRILVVEDDIHVRELFQRILSRHGNVVTAVDGEDGFKCIDDQFFDVILTDIDMPRMDGLTMFHKCVEKWPEVAERFIICTANPKPCVIETANKYGVPLLAKPSSISSIYEALASILEIPIPL